MVARLRESDSEPGHLILLPILIHITPKCKWPTMAPLRTIDRHCHGVRDRLALSCPGAVTVGIPNRLPQGMDRAAWYTKALDLDEPIDLLLHKMFELISDIRAGLVVASCDVLLLLPAGFRTQWPSARPALQSSRPRRWAPTTARTRPRPSPSPPTPPRGTAAS